MTTENVTILGENGSRETAQHKEYVVFLAVKPKDAVALSEKLRSSHFELQDYECILKAATEEMPKWDRLLKMIELDRLRPEVPGKILPLSYCNLLLSKKQKDYEICPGLYDLISEQAGSVIIVKGTKELQKDLLIRGLLGRTSFEREHGVVVL